ncbi:MAG: hypothetical protein Q8M40_04195 [Legionella sp.]|nr:hypothetical protein [Legionella sp.]HRD68822.1 hypothetical protein [Legionella sp.]
MDIKKILESLIPFLVVGVAIALCIGLLFMFFSVAVWGLLIGGVLWLGALAKQYLFPGTQAVEKKSNGRIIEHNNKK